jgi:DNA-binding NarL/FixJ family response regulator
MTNENPRIVIVEDHPVMREGLVVLLDINLKDGWGLDIIPWLQTQNAKKKYSAL